MELLPFQTLAVEQLVAARKSVLRSLVPGVGSTTMALAALFELARRDGAGRVYVLAPLVAHPHIRATAAQLATDIDLRVVNPEWLVRYPGVHASWAHALVVAGSGYNRGTLARDLLFEVAEASQAIVVTMGARTDERPSDWYRQRYPGVTPPRSLRRELEGLCGLVTVDGPSQDVVLAQMRAGA